VNGDLPYSARQFARRSAGAESTLEHSSLKSQHSQEHGDGHCTTHIRTRYLSVAATVRSPLPSASSVSRTRSSVKITAAVLMKCVYCRKMHIQTEASQVLM
jgi:hypothetical protein